MADSSAQVAKETKQALEDAAADDMLDMAVPLINIGLTVALHEQLERIANALENQDYSTEALVQVVNNK